MKYTAIFIAVKFYSRMTIFRKKLSYICYKNRLWVLGLNFILIATNTKTENTQYPGSESDKKAKACPDMEANLATCTCI